MGTFWGIAAHSVDHLFALSCLFIFLFISQFGFKSGIWLLIAPVPVHCFSITLTISFYTFKPLSHWDVTSSRWVSESICQTVANCRETFTWYRKVLACIANSSRTVRQSFKHVVLFCATKIIAKPSPSHCICSEPVANPSPTLRKHIAKNFPRSAQCDKYAT